MKRLINKDCIVFFIISTMVLIAITSFIAGYTDDKIVLHNPLYILGTAIFSTISFKYLSTKTHK